MDKKEGARHLLHAAIRMFIAKEDPFAIHLLVQSADKVITDYAKKVGKALAADFDAHLRPENKKEAYAILRETYNYLKHADSDWDKSLEVRDLVRLNAITLFYCVANFGAIFGETTDHMRLILSLNSALFPEIFKQKTPPMTFRESMRGLADSTPSEMLDAMNEFITLVLPNFSEEKKADLADIGGFYELLSPNYGKKLLPVKTNGSYHHLQLI